MANKKKGTRESDKTFTSGAAFIRSQPESMKAKDVVAKAKAVGLTIEINTVYSARHEMRKRKGRKNPGARGRSRFESVPTTFTRRRAPIRSEEATTIRATHEAHAIIPREDVLRTMETHAREMLLAAALFVGVDEAILLLQTERGRAAERLAMLADRAGTIQASALSSLSVESHLHPPIASSVPGVPSETASAGMAS